MEREGGWWPAGPRRREPAGRTVVAEVLLVVAVALSLVVGVLAAVVLVLAVSTVVQALVGPEVTGRLEVQLVSWGLLVGLALWLPFALVAAVAALVGHVEARFGDDGRRRAAGSPAGAAGSEDRVASAIGRSDVPGSERSTADPSEEPTDAGERDG